MAQQSLLIILNPTAGAGRAVKKMRRVESSLHRSGVPYELCFTESPGHAIDLAREAVAHGSYRTVVAAGGDGTVNEVINGLMSARETSAGTSGTISDSLPDSFPDIGVLPVGRGNDFAFGAGIPSDIEEAVRLLVEGSAYRMDVGRIRGGRYPKGRYFGNGIGIGFDTIVGLEAAKAGWAPGALGYAYGALKTFLLFPLPPRLRIRYGEKLYEGRSNQISIMNGRRMGGAFFMAPKADNSDGLLDLCMPEKALSRREMARALLQYTRGTQIHNPIFRLDAGSGFSIEAVEGVLICHADGETISTDAGELHVECIPGALRLQGVEQRVEEAPVP